MGAGRSTFTLTKRTCLPERCVQRCIGATRVGIAAPYSPQLDASEIFKPSHPVLVNVKALN